MSDRNEGSDNTQVNHMVAPTYNELHSAVAELREKLRLLEASSAPKNLSSESIPKLETMPTVDYRILPDVERQYGLSSDTKRLPKQRTGLVRLTDWCM